MTLLTSIEAEKPDAMTLQSDAIIPAVSLSNVSLSLCFRTFFSLVHSIPSPSPLCNVLSLFHLNRDSG
jgi:hypothetical protein